MFAPLIRRLAWFARLELATAARTSHFMGRVPPAVINAELRRRMATAAALNGNSTEVPAEQPRQTVDVAYLMDADGEPFAVFPNTPLGRPDRFAIYAHIGQHGEADRDYCTYCRAATADEAAALHDELTRVYSPHPLAVVDRPAW